jgi:hypothetical protein
MLLLILAFALAIWGVYLFIPNRGVNGFVVSVITVSGFLSLVYLVKWVILI